jgi:cohesin loading factor subunit SCC2
VAAQGIRQVSSLDDVKSSHKEDSNAAKAIALEHLGVIAARIRASMLKWNASNEQSACLKSLDEVRP